MSFGLYFNWAYMLTVENTFAYCGIFRINGSPRWRGEPVLFRGAQPRKGRDTRMSLTWAHLGLMSHNPKFPQMGHYHTIESFV